MSIYDKDFIEKMQILKDFEGNLHGITVCSVLDNFIRYLALHGFKIEQIVLIINFLLLQFNINFKLKYYHVYHYINQNKIKIKKIQKEVQEKTKELSIN